MKYPEVSGELCRALEAWTEMVGNTLFDESVAKPAVLPAQVSSVVREKTCAFTQDEKAAMNRLLCEFGMLLVGSAITVLRGHGGMSVDTRAAIIDSATREHIGELIGEEFVEAAVGMIEGDSD